MDKPVLFRCKHCTRICVLKIAETPALVELSKVHTEGCDVCGGANHFFNVKEFIAKAEEPPSLVREDIRYRIVDSIDFDAPLRGVREDNYPEVIRKPARSFLANITRAQAVVLTPAFVGGAQMTAGKRISQCNLLVFGSLDAPPNASEDDWRRYDVEWKRLADELAKHPKGYMIAQVWSRALDSLDFGISRMGFPEGPDSVLASLILGLWTAMEVLAKDLWVEVVNSRPKTLGIAAMQAAPFTLDKEDAPEPTEENSKGKQKLQSFSVEDIRDYGPDFTNRMGSAISNWRKFNFNRIRGWIHAYDQVFDLKAKDLKLDGELHTTARVLELVRNVLIHNGGIVDVPFLQKIGKIECPSWFVVPKEKERVALTGTMCKIFGDAVVVLGLAWLGRVKEWLEAHP